MDAHKVLIGITGGIAAYKIPALVRLLRKNGCEVKTVITNAAKTLVGVDALRTLSGFPVYMDGESFYDMDHIRLSEWADVFAICPATANTIAKISCGIADNLLTTLALSIEPQKIIVAPAMNVVMWENKITQSNIVNLTNAGINVLSVDVGELACGTSGAGRMADVEKICEEITSKLKSKPFKGGSVPPQRPPRALVGVRVLISAGPTEEPIDPVRVITNKSSGKMGAALARAAIDMGAEVVVVCCESVAKKMPVGVDVISIKTAKDLEDAMVGRFDKADICIMSAAVSDYRVVNPSDKKIKRGDEKITLELTPNHDILKKLGDAKKGQYIVGFSLENDDGDIERAREKMARKKCDMMIFNTAQKSLGTDDTAFTIISKDGGVKESPHVSKTDGAKIIMEEIAQNIKQERTA